MPIPIESNSPDAAPKPVNVSRVFLGYLADIVFPMALYFILHHLGVSDVAALAAGIAVAFVTTAVNTIRRGRIDRVGIIVLLEIALSIALLFLLHDRRLILAKPSFYSALIGVYIIATTFGAHPINYEAIRSIGSDGDPFRARAFDACWTESSKFRAALRTSAIGWGLAFLADAILRVIIVYRFPFDRAAWVSNVPHFGAILVLIGFSAAMGRVTKRLVDDQVAQMKSV
jgi:intracellular septation protein A